MLHELVELFDEDDCVVVLPTLLELVELPEVTELDTLLELFEFTALVTVGDSAFAELIARSVTFSPHA